MTIARLLRISYQRIRSLVRKDAVDAEVARELAFHFDLLRVLPLPLPDADRLVVLRTFPLASPAQVSAVPLSDYLAWRERSRTFEAFGMSLVHPRSTAIIERRSRM